MCGNSRQKRVAETYKFGDLVIPNSNMLKLVKSANRFWHHPAFLIFLPNFSMLC